jgi:hypothetical protein
MSTTKIEVLALVDFLSASLADQNECSRIFDEVLLELAHDPRAWITNFAYAATGTLSDTSDADQYEVSTSVGKLLGVFYGGRQLSEETIAALAATNPRWREELGDPWAYTRQGEDGRTLRLYPKPRHPGSTTGATTDARYSPFILFTQVVSGAIPDALCIPLTLLVLAREFERESNHRDLGVAEIWRSMGTDMLDKVY